MSKWIKYITETLFLLFLINTTVVSQGNITPKEPVSEYSENLTFFIDRNIYLSGEDIWFYASLSANSNELYSKTLYVELYNKDNALRKKFSIEDGGCEGYLSIPADFNSGGYFMRAYTNYQKNFLPEHFAHQVLFIANPRKGIREHAAYNLEKSNDVDTGNTANHFLPNVYCALKKGDHNPVKDVEIEKLNEHYRIDIHTKSAYDENNNLVLLVRNAKFELIKREQLDTNKALIASKNLTTGLNYFLLLNDSKPVATGCIYEKDDRLKQLKLNVENEKYAARQKVAFSLEQQIENQHAYKAVLSVVKKRTRFQNKDTSFIYKLVALNPYLLNDYTDIFPGIEPLPDNFLNIALKNHTEAIIANPVFLDKITSNSLEYIPEIYDLSISGNLKRKSDTLSSGNQRVYLSIFGDKPQFHVYNTKENGFFVFNIENVTGVHDAYLTTDPDESGDVEILVKSDFSRDFYPDKIPMLIDTSYRELLEEMYLTQQIQNRLQTADSSAKRGFDPLPPIERNAETIWMKDYVELPTMVEVFKEIIPNVFIRKRNGNHKVFVFDEKRDLLYSEPLILLDNLPILNHQTLLSITPAKVERISVISEPYYIGEHKFNGIVSIHTKTNDFGGVEFNGNSIFLKYTTYSPSATFVKTVPKSRNLPHFSNLLFWQVADMQKLRKNFVSPDNEGVYEIFLRVLKNSASTGYFGKESFLPERE